MDISLDILPLEILEDLVPQKCLLTKELFSNQLRPGDFAKCMFSDGGFSVCQVYPRDFTSWKRCYMDHCVTSRLLQDGVPTKLIGLQRLRASKAVNEVHIVLNINEEFLLNYQSTQQLTLDYFKNAVQHFLQLYQLTVGCTIRSKHLVAMGISSVDIKAAAGGIDNNSSFNISFATNLHIVDVRLSTLQDKMLKMNFHNIGFEGPLQRLKELLQVIKKHKESINKFRISSNALVIGPSGCGKSTLVVTFIRESLCNCFHLSAAQVLGQYPGETETQCRRVFAAARRFQQNLKPKYPTIILLEDLHLLCPAVDRETPKDADTNLMRTCLQLLSLVDRLHIEGIEVICLATTSSPDSLNEIVRRPGRFEYEINIDALDVEKRKQVFVALFEESFLARHMQKKLSAEILDEIGKQTQGYVAADLCLLLHNVEQLAIREDKFDLNGSIRNILKKLCSTSLRGSDVSVFRPEHGFHSIGGMVELKRILQVSILAGLRQQKAFQRFGLSLPKGVLFYGPPGCAKTTIAKCLAAEANMTFIITSGAEVYSPYVGCAEKFITKIFNTARKNTPCLIFLDEIDTLIGRRTVDNTSTGSRDVQIRILSTLLTEMDGIISSSGANANQHILVVAATNRPDMIDDALLRPGRLDKLIYVPTPDLKSRLSILELMSQRMPFATDVNLDSIAQRTANYSGADLCNFCNEAAMQALQRDFDTTVITIDDFEIVLQILKSSLTTEQIEWYTDYQRKFHR